MYFNVVMLLTLFKKRGDFSKSPKLNKAEKLPKVTLIVPAYNEGSKIAESIKSIKQVDYPKELLQIIVVNDGSTDNTSQVIKNNIKNITFLDNKKNKGKAACLNQAIRMSKGEFIGTMDADSEVSRDILKKTIPYFKEQKVGAVTVTVKVKNPHNFLQKVIEIEYALGLSLALKVLSYFNTVHVTPGPFSIYRKSMFNKIGLFDEKNITEDLEIAHRIQKHRYRIECCTTTHVKTIIPSTLKSLYIQRKRWYSGALLTFKKHKDVVFNPRLGAFGFVLPYMYTLVTLGLALFLFSSYLGLSTLVKSISFYSLTNFNFISYLVLYNWDILSLSTLTIFAVMALCTTLFVALVGLKFAKKDIRKVIPGIIGFVFLFILYQAFWASSFYAVIFKKELKWRQ